MTFGSFTFSISEIEYLIGVRTLFLCLGGPTRGRHLSRGRQCQLSRYPLSDGPFGNCGFSHPIPQLNSQVENVKDPKIMA